MVMELWDPWQAKSKYVVLGSPVQSGLSPIFGKTETETGLQQLEDPQKLDRTDVNRFMSVLCGFLRLRDRSEPVTVQTSS